MVFLRGLTAGPPRGLAVSGPGRGSDCPGDRAHGRRCPVGVMRQSVKPELASWDRAGHPSQVKLARFLAQVDAVAGPVLATVSGRVLPS
jgi:hypothetical protein